MASARVRERAQEMLLFRPCMNTDSTSECFALQCRTKGVSYRFNALWGTGDSLYAVQSSAQKVGTFHRVACLDYPSKCSGPALYTNTIRIRNLPQDSCTTPSMLLPRRRACLTLALLIRRRWSLSGCITACGRCRTTAGAAPTTSCRATASRRAASGLCAAPAAPRRCGPVGMQGFPFTRI